MKQTLLIFIFNFCFGIIISQNLIKNPGFEEYDSGMLYGYQPCNWITGGYVSPYDNLVYINHSIEDTLLPVIYPIFYEKPYSGQAMVALNIIDPKGITFLYGTLSKPLLKGKKYNVSFYYKFDNSSTHCISKISINFTTTANVNYAFDNPDFNPAFKHYVKTDLTLKDKQFSNDPINWNKASLTFISKGGEDRIVLGYFFPENSSLKKLKYDTSFKKAQRIVKRDKNIIINKKDANYLYSTYFIDEILVELIK
jgi:hypothetical protein